MEKGHESIQQSSDVSRTYVSGDMTMRCLNDPSGSDH